MREHEKNAKVFKAFCDANRLKVMHMLQSGEKCACQLLKELNVGQSTLSHHMKILCDAGIVSARKDGKWMHYSFNPGGILTTRSLLEQITTATHQNPVNLHD